MKVTPPYNFCSPEERGEWFDIVVALVQYLQSGESRVGFLNKQHSRNMLHKDVEAQVEADEEKMAENKENVPDEKGDRTDSTTRVGPLRRSTRTRPVDVAGSDRESKRR